MYIYERVKLNKNVPVKFISVNFIDECENVNEGVHKRHWHRSIEILIPIEGELYVWTSKCKISVKSGDIYIINTKEIHVVSVNREKIYKGYLVQINYEDLIKCYSNMDSIYFEQITDEEVKREILRCVEKIYNSYGLKDEHKGVKIFSLLIEIIYILLHNQKKERVNKKLINNDKYKERILGITEYIDKNYKEELSVSLLSEMFNLSYAHLSRIFKENLQITIKEYITKVRIKECEKYLINTDYPIIQVAMENGFPNLQSFYKEFKKEYKVTPLEYRRNAIK